jgi:hypothetical protein
MPSFGASCSWRAIAGAKLLGVRVEPKAYPQETTEAFLDGHVSAFAFFGGVPHPILYDNTKIRGGEDLRRGEAGAHARLHRAMQPLPVPRSVRATGKGQR